MNTMYPDTSEDQAAISEMYEHMTAAEGYAKQMAEQMLDDIGYDTNCFEITVTIKDKNADH